jgi:hypothetical protein
VNDTQLFPVVGMPTLVVSIGILINLWQVSAINTRITDLRQDIDARFNDLKDTWRAKLGRVEEILGARLEHLEDR